MFDDDFTSGALAGQPRSVATAPFELSQLMEIQLEPGVHYVQASARHHRSNVLEIVCS